jgi:cation diffusion facilitator CzcD-associated flavoprotein CzcO
MSSGSESHLPIAIVGAGFAGIGLAIKLREAGIEDFEILEPAHELGGTWRDNTYPGCACDVASPLYSYSFAPNPDWSRSFSRQPEILEYLRAIAQEHDVERHVRYDTELLEARWDDDAAHWALSTSRGDLTADVIVPATGPFGDPVTPDIPGLDRFQGAMFHSLHWDHEHDLEGASGSRCSGREPPPCSSSPRSSREPAACWSSSARRRGSFRASTAASRRRSARCFGASRRSSARCAA